MSASIVYDRAAPKRPTNVTINEDLWRRARDLNINISRVVEDALAEQVRRAAQAAWLRDNADAIADYNEQVERQGVFSDGLRSF